MRELNHDAYKLLTNSIYGPYSKIPVHFWAIRPETPAEGDMWCDSETNTVSMCVRRGTELVAVQMDISNGGKKKTEDELRAEKLKDIVDY